MGEIEGWAQPPIGLLPNGLLPNEAASVIKVVNSERWMKAEERTAELIAHIQPSPPSVERRNAVADYVQRLIMKCFPCQVGHICRNIHVRYLFLGCGLYLAYELKMSKACIILAGIML
ncbi:hypothetical protein Lalb_Chr10g0100421 [Lupinus albus]|uniref:Uncharacterized protein n=1 Tax=Lupinus albus TaxID=3870 RepID=A0A6A4PVM8_LUPAL|nr:hypothetical protein Lalb_Chr10g0100421 [Lupinus albus]